MRSLLIKSVAVAALAAAFLVPAAAATSSPRVKVPILPLPKSALGSAAAALDLQFGSGIESDQEAAYEAGVSPKRIKKLGRITGARLIYGSLFLAGNGLDEFQTSVDEYKTARDAKRALPFWKKQSSFDVQSYSQLNLTASRAPLSVPRIGGGRWATLDTFSVPGTTSLYYLSEEFCDGRFVIDVTIAADSESSAKAFAKTVARAVDKRLHVALAGRLHGKAIKPPGRPQVGPPASGPDPSGMVLTTSDFPLSQLQQQGYDWLPESLSTYDVLLSPAGAFDDVFQSVSLMPNPTSAAYVAALDGAGEIAGELAFAGASFTQVTPVDMTGVGDDAQGAILEISGGGQTLNEAVVTLNAQSVADVVIADSSSTISASDVQSMAHRAATRLNAGLGG